MDAVSLHLSVCGLMLRINDLDIDIDIHGPNKSKVFWRILTPLSWKIVEAEHKMHIYLLASLSESSSGAIKALGKIRQLSGAETKELLSLPLEEMCKELILKVFLEGGN